MAAAKRQLMLGVLTVGAVVGGAAALGEAHGPPSPAIPATAVVPTSGSSGAALTNLRTEEAQLQAAIVAARQKLTALVVQQTQSQASLSQQAQELTQRQNQLTQEAGQLTSERSALQQEAAQLAARASSPPPAHATTGASGSHSSDDGGGRDG